jgi:4-hydroxy-3-polyprenylbenzoate decarboxylase
MEKRVPALAMRTVVGVTGASGAPYAYRLLETLEGEIDLILSRDAEEVIRLETGREPADLAKLATRTFRNEDMAAPPASGSYPFDAMVIVPCSGTTLAKVAAGIADNLITRAAAVALKERRTLILVPRDTPLSPIMLENLVKLANAGATILPAMPGFYHRPKTVQQLVDFVVARILDHLGQKQDLVEPWKGLPAEKR